MHKTKKWVSSKAGLVFSVFGTALSTLLVLDQCYILPITKHIFRPFSKWLV